MESYEEIAQKVRSWSKERGLDKAEPVAQFAKLIEEAGELSAGLLRKRGDQIVDAIGDVMVVLTILCQQLRLEPVNCFRAAYEEIKGRTGETREGVFIKSEDVR